MKTRYYILPLAAAALLAGCNKELHEIDAPAEDIAPVKTVLTVGLEPETSTYMDPSDGKVYWSNGDQIAVNGVESEALAGLEGDVQSAEFTFGGVLSTPYNVLYPASIYTDATHITLPAVQDYNADAFADGMFPMAGYSADGNSLNLSHLCAIVRISVKRASSGTVDEDNIVAVRFKGRNSEKVSGSFEIDYQTAALTAATGSDADLEVRVTKSKATSTSTAVVYNIVVPARTYANGFDIIVQDVNGHIMTKSKIAEWKPVPGHLYNMPEFEFVPTATELGIEISNAQELIDFATAYNNNTYAGLGDGLVATVTNDITFTAAESADFNATGGIGTSNNGSGDTNYFNGVFNGNNHTISGLIATVPVFAFTGGGGIVKDLNLDSTCSYTVNTSTGNNHGPLVGRNKGTVQNCTSAASVIINNIQDVNTANQNYGGLVGYNPGGTIDGCLVSGDITCSQTGQTITANNAYIGGIAGYQQDEGTIEDCTFTGNITVSDATTYGGITAKNIFVAGILGRAEKCVISGCTAGINGTPRAIDVRGVMVPAIGGIIGWCANAVNSEISDCHNYMSLSFASSGARADTSPCRIGGIAARSAALVKNCTNAGAISSVCNSTTLELAGIVADGVNVIDCTNNAGGTITRTNANQTAAQANRYIYLGGIMGNPNAAGVITDCTNHATVTCNPTGTASGTTVDMGGIVGGGNASKMNISGCTNDGEIKFDNDNATAAALTRTAVGGILGNVSTDQTSVTECDNSGKVWCNNNTSGFYGPITIGGVIGRSSASCTVTDCVNSGAILCQKVGASTKTTVDVGGIVGWAEGQITISGTSSGDTSNSGTVDVAEDNSTTTVYARITMGGILGFASAANSTITNSNNSNQVHCEFQGSGNNRCSYIGGIAGVMASLTYESDGTPKGFGGQAGFEISSCNNTGAVWSRNLNTSGGNKTGNFTGGIVGALSGIADNKASLHDCTSASGQTTNYRGFAGGIAGYLSYANLSDNSASQIISGNAKNGRGSGGIVGSAQNESTLSNCTFSGTINTVQNIGGLAYILSGNSSITGCKVDGATLTKGTNASATAAAVLVSNAASGATITNCGVKGTLDGAAIDLSSNMITTNDGATVTGTYLIP